MPTFSLKNPTNSAAILVCVIALSLPFCALANTGQKIAFNVEHLRQVGEARLTKLFWTIYDSRLYTTSGLYRGIEPDLVLEITYQREINREQLINSTRKEWQALSRYRNYRSESWLSRLQEMWPDVNKGDVLRVQVGHDMSSHFYFNGNAIGSIKNPEFTHDFLAIWLSPNSRYSELQQQLTGVNKPM